MSNRRKAPSRRKSLTHGSEVRGRPGARKVFLIAYEDAKVEPEYFRRLRIESGCRFQVKTVRHRGSAPKNVLAKMNHAIEKLAVGYDEAWIVVDTDKRSKQEFAEICDWARKTRNHHVALSNPMFEYWLILHYKGRRTSVAKAKSTKRPAPNMNDAKTKEKCKSEFERCSGFRTGGDLPSELFSNVGNAIRESEGRMTEIRLGWPEVEGWTTIHLLVKRLLNS